MRILFFTLFIIFQIVGYGQYVNVKEKNSYYLGQRSAINLQIVSTASETPMIILDNNSSSWFHLHFYPKLEYTFGLNNKWAAKVVGSVHSQTRFSDRAVYIKDLTPGGSRYREVGNPKMIGKTIGLRISKFRTKKGALAPIGNHWSIGISEHFINVSHEGMSYVNKDDPNDFVRLDAYDVNFNYLSLHLDFAHRKIISNNLYYQIGIESAFNIGLIKPSDESVGSENHKIHNNLLEASETSYWGRDFITLSIGMGYVIK